MAGAASAHQAATSTREDTSQQRAGRTRRTSGDPQRAQQRATADAAAAPAALDSLSRLQQLADASPQVAQLRRLQALADGRSAPVAQLAGGPEEEELVQGKFAAAQLQPQLQQAPRANNTGLPDQLKSGIESLSGLSMDHVRVHYNSSQPAQLNALAYAQGKDIHLAPGQERHLPHEAWHVVQQAQGRVLPTLQLNDGVQVNDDAGLEREADVMGRKATHISDTRHLRAHSALPSSLAKRKNSGILMQRKIYTHKDEQEKPKEIGNLDSYNNTETPECRAILKYLHEQEGYYFIEEALKTARTHSAQNLIAASSVGATNSGAAPLASAVPPPSIPDQKLHKPVVVMINIKGSSAFGDNKNQTQSTPVKVKAPTLDEQAEAIMTDMNWQFNTWDLSKRNRGAFWGCKRPGQIEGAKSIPSEVLEYLKKKAKKNGWFYTDSRTSDMAFHKYSDKSQFTFIYHIHPPDNAFN
jgi:hypothetical protein